MTPEQALATALRSSPNHPWMVLPGPTDITGGFVVAAMKWFSENSWELAQVITPPLPDRMRAAAETIELINAMSGLGLNCSASPIWLRREAERMELEGVG